MKLLFCHDGPIEKTRNGVYYSIGFNDVLCDRYEVIANDISLAMRVHHVETSNKKINKSHLLSRKYKVVECPNISSVKGIVVNRAKCRKILEKAISSSDIVIVRLPSFIGNLAIDVCKKFRKLYVVELVGCPWDSLRNRSMIGKIIAPIMWLKTKNRVKNSPYVVYVTERFLQHRYPTNGKSISCSDVELPKNICNMRVKTIDRDKTITLGTIGKLDVKYKGQQYVIKAMKELKKSELSIKYSIVGPGKSDYLRKVAIKNGVIDDVEFCGELSHDKIFEWLKGVDIYIQPSTTEGMPRSLIEAMSVGCVCLASDVGGISELLKKERIFVPKKSGGIVEAVNKILFNDKARRCDVYDCLTYYDKSVLRRKREAFLINIKKEAMANGKQKR